MKVHLMNDESIIWNIHQGKNYRTFFLIRDLFLGLIITALIHYVTNNLLDLEGGQVWTITGIVLLLVLGVAGIHQLLLMSKVYVLTTERIIIKKSLLSRNLTSIKLINIIDTKVEQSFKERFIRSGSIYLFTANDSQNDDDKFTQKTPKLANVDSPFKKHAEIVEYLKIAHGETK